MKNTVKTLIIVTVILAIVASTVYAISIKNKSATSTVEVNAAKVEKGEIVSLISTTGVVESKSKQEYYILSPTKVSKVYVSVGDNVKRGDKLLEFETQDLYIQYQIAQKQLEIAQMQLDALKKLKEKQSQQSQVAAQLPNTSLPQQLLREKVQYNSPPFLRCKLLLLALMTK
ncbi:efflux RND transporter periplasmic adaptor subunit [Thermoanaerobacter thermocopriae]|nr:efflux RND transporter periplasmic adaptor subunit [Thermoanaerobacter thermocopriae]